MNAFRWLFGIRWNRKAVEAERDSLLSKEFSKAEDKANDAYEKAMRQIAEVPEEDRVGASLIADELLVRLAAIEMERDVASALIRDEYGRLIEKMSRESKSCIGRWLDRKRRADK